MDRERLFLGCAALAGGAVGYFIGIPLGVMLGSASGVLLLQTFWKRLKPMKVMSKKSIQSLIGGITGLNLSASLFETLFSLWHIIFIFIFIHIFSVCVLVLMLHRCLKWDLITAICSAVPAGLSEIVVLTDGLNVPMHTIIISHLLRVTIILLVIPISLTFIF